MANKSEKSPQGFIKKHPILFNILLIVAVDFVLLVIAYQGLAWFTNHNQYEIVPDLKGMTVDEATRALATKDLKFEITDSIYTTSVQPGMVIEQVPKAGSKIKNNRAVYATIRCFSAQIVTVPQVVDMSVRQGMSTLNGLGIKNITIEKIPSEYSDLIYELKMNGLPLHAGDKIPVDARLMLIVGDGSLGINDEALLNEYNETVNELQSGDSSENDTDIFE